MRIAALAVSLATVAPAMTPSAHAQENAAAQIARTWRQAHEREQLVQREALGSAEAHVAERQFRTTGARGAPPNTTRRIELEPISTMA